MRVMLFPIGNRFRILMLLSLLCLLGCVRVDAEKNAPEATRLVVTKDTKDGVRRVRMQFQSTQGLKYSIYYRDTMVPNDEWHLLPQATEIDGTGELMMVVDTSPRAIYRKYRIHSLIPVNRKDLK